MDNLERIKDIFDKTKKISNFWTDYEEEYTENPQTSHILNYLCLTACYLKSKKEAEIFKEKWLAIKDTLRSGSDQQDWLNQSHMINSHLEQALLEESIHNPNDERNMGIESFYENTFLKLYNQAEKIYKEFQNQQDNMVKAMQKHYEEVHATQKSWEEALMRGDPAAFCD